MLRNDQIQAGLVSYIKSKTDITVEIGSPNEIREDQWQGTEFTYPNIRVRMLPPVTPIAGTNCSHIRFSVSFMAFSEEASSMQSDRIAGIIADKLSDTQFVSNSIAFSLRITNLVPAIRSDARTWRAEAIFQGVASG